MGNRPFLAGEELFLSWCAGELALGAEGQVDHVVVFRLIVLDDLEGHGDISETASVLAGSLPGSTHGQEPGLVQRDVPDGLARRVELELLLLFFAWSSAMGDLYSLLAALRPLRQPDSHASHYWVDGLFSQGQTGTAIHGKTFRGAVNIIRNFKLWLIIIRKTMTGGG